MAKGRVGLSIGNVIGSNILDLLLPIGVSGILHPIRIDPGILVFDLPVSFLLASLVLVWSIRRVELDRRHGAVLIGCYVGYAALRFFTS